MHIRGWLICGVLILAFVLLLGCVAAVFFKTRR